MVSEKIEETIGLLEYAGFVVDRAFPGVKAGKIQAPKLTVMTERYDAEALVLAVDIFAPGEIGGRICEDMAQRVVWALKNKLATFTVGKCRFLGQPGWFTVRVLVQWYREAECSVEIDGVPIQHLVSCCATMHSVRIPYVDSMTGETLETVEANRWDIEVKDIWPLNQEMVPEQSVAFKLTVEREGGKEFYPRCVWREVTLEETPAGVLRTRVAQTYQGRNVGKA